MEEEENLVDSDDKSLSLLHQNLNLLNLEKDDDDEEDF